MVNKMNGLPERHVANHFSGNYSYVQHLQEHEKFARFTDNLLSRASKLSELSQALESALAESGKAEDSPDGKRVKKL